MEIQYIYCTEFLCGPIGSLCKLLIPIGPLRTAERQKIRLQPLTMAFLFIEIYWSVDESTLVLKSI